MLRGGRYVPRHYDTVLLLYCGYYMDVVIPFGQCGGGTACEGSGEKTTKENREGEKDQVDSSGRRRERRHRTRQQGGVTLIGR